MNLLEVLEKIDPSKLNYLEWTQVGMALKYEGYTANDWDVWSAKDHERYHPGECYSKWNSFNGNSNPVTAGTIYQLAKQQGYVFTSNDNDYGLDWDATIEKDEQIIIDKGWIEGKEFEEPANWNPKEQLIRYLETLFEPDENVGYVTKSWEKDGKSMPSKGLFDRTSEALIKALLKADTIEEVVGDYNKEVGAWIRFNPLDGKGIKNDNVTDFRYALVESDSMDLAKQNAIIRELELPVACLVYSGKKSVHAIVRINADNYSEYRKRVDFLYSICKKNGLEIDIQNKNPSRLSRMPGVIRNGHKQFIIDTNIGKSDWNEWKEWIDSVNDDLPEPESLEDFWDNMPELAKPLIDGVLRQGHKMLIAGPSKAGKSFALIEMCIALAEGKKWLGWQCAQGRVLYVNLELDRSSCLHRFRDVYKALNISPNNLHNIDIWNLRGKSIPMDKLAPKLIRRASKKNYLAVIIDPIYKVITGDENSADQMANFCNQFDKVCNELNVSVIYCHHHSKGAQGGKRSMDRASGSGVFARDPDALIDLIELELTDAIKKQLRNNAVSLIYRNYLDNNHQEDSYSRDDLCSAAIMRDIAMQNITVEQFSKCENEVKEKESEINSITAWRIEGTLREFPKFDPVNLWFQYPIHKIDNSYILKDIDPDMPGQFQKYEKKKDNATKLSDFEQEFQNIELEGRDVTAKELSERLGISTKTLGSWLGDSSKSKANLKKKFIKYFDSDKQILYIKRQK